ncbi:hypothetical protein NQ318_005206 [Aromia moschata]|uniref:Uncharacterized protein n=1 Tax=Aromia moschata TaxID=1265417 RepID=A0AAV8YC39_9CUCU|nr:hypothetical protein NQ318_005206 [Aromia moschata]
MMGINLLDMKFSVLSMHGSICNKKFYILRIFITIPCTYTEVMQCATSPCAVKKAFPWIRKMQLDIGEIITSVTCLSIRWITY